MARASRLSVGWLRESSAGDGARRREILFVALPRPSPQRNAGQAATLANVTAISGLLTEKQTK